MFDKNFDKQKLMYHPRALAQWLTTGQTAGPIYTEMELCSACNCRCVFCGVDYLVNKSRDMMDVALAGKIIDGLGEIGNRSIMFCGHGESLLHPRAEEIIARAGETMSTSVTTNGTVLTEERLGLIDRLEWLRFSINGTDPENYAAVHGTNPEMFDRVMANLAAAVQRKKRLGLDVTIGTQLVLLNENAAGVVDLARRVQDVGVDYFSVKPYSHHPLSEHTLAVDYSVIPDLEPLLTEMEDDGFKVIYRSGSMAKAGRPKGYRKCYGTNFLCFVSANGDVWECNVFAGDDRFCIGNVQNQTLAEIWAGPRRAEVLEWIETQMDIDACRDICRMDECNRYLWRLKHPWPHDNFI